ncbi:hypothetical protein D3C72_1877900 [compost metagenome]
MLTMADLYHASTKGKNQRFVFDQQGSVKERGTQRCRERHRGLAIGLREQEQKLLATNPTQCRQSRAQFSQPIAKIDQGRVPNLMTPLIVDLLEVVQIEHQHAERTFRF